MEEWTFALRYVQLVPLVMKLQPILDNVGKHVHHHILLKTMIKEDVLKDVIQLLSDIKKHALIMLLIVHTHLRDCVMRILIAAQATILEIIQLICVLIVNIS